MERSLSPVHSSLPVQTGPWSVSATTVPVMVNDRVFKSIRPRLFFASPSNRVPLVAPGSATQYRTEPAYCGEGATCHERGQGVVRMTLVPMKKTADGRRPFSRRPRLAVPTRFELPHLYANRARHRSCNSSGSSTTSAALTSTMASSSPGRSRGKTLSLQGSRT